MEYFYVDGGKIIGLFVTIVAMWHVLGFAFGLVYINFSLRSLFNLIPYDRQWSKVIRSADLHLWISGSILIALGSLQKGTEEYLSNPKLWCKVTVVVIWFLSTQLMRRVGIPNLKKGDTGPMMKLSAINIGCWIYGAFLGCAKPLSDGVVSYSEFILGFICTIILSFLSLYYIKKHGCVSRS